MFRSTDGGARRRVDALSPHAVGLLLTTTGVLVLSPDSWLIRIVDADAWTIVFWRTSVMFTTVTIAIAVVSKGHPIRQFRAIGLIGLVVAALFGAQLTLFVTSVTRTSVANTLVIFATAPLFAAALSRIFLRERVPRRVWVAVTVCLAAVGFIFIGSIGTGRLGGDAAAAAAALALATGLTVIRRHRAVSMVPAWAVGALFAAIASSGLADPTDVSGPDLLVLLISGMVVLPIAFGLIALGPRRLSAPETGLIMLLETIIGPVWVWVALSERPTVEALIGGAVVIGVLVANSFIGLRESPVDPPPAASLAA